ncbi:MAG: flavodoxin domain-containing protein [Candidatus Thorarchaeota archaeon]|jgi:flavorubredoxin
MKVIVIYESTRGRTKAMANAICEGAKAKGKDCEVIDAKDFSDIGDACGLAVGSSTRMKRPLPKVRQVISELKPLDGLPVVAYGSYGWSGEAPGEIAGLLKDKGGTPVGEPLRVKDHPSEEMLGKCRELGAILADSCS